MLAGYYVHVEPGGSFLAGGLYMPPAETLKKVRDEIYFQPEEFKKIIYQDNFVKCFGILSDPEKLKNPPKGYPKDFPEIDLLKYRNYAVMHFVPDEIILKPDYGNYAIEVFKTLLPLNNYFNRMFL